MSIVRRAGDPAGSGGGATVRTRGGDTLRTTTRAPPAARWPCGEPLRTLDPVMPFPSS